MKPNEVQDLMPIIDNPFVASWSAKGHTLCLGYWTITYKGLPLNLPNSRKENHMETFGIFSWLFPDDEDYAEGLEVDDWIDKNADWLLNTFEQHSIPFDEKHITWFYDSINEEDWRCGSCGGCI